MNTFERIRAVVSQIPKGKVATYGQIAKLAGVPNPRVVGFAMASNKDPNNVPCHRVVKADGALAGYGLGGANHKRARLEEEGITFGNNDIIDLEKYQWDGNI